MERPTAGAILPLGGPIEISGRVEGAGGQRVRCNGHPMKVGPSGRFRGRVPGPSEPGLFLVGCVVPNERNEEYHFRYGWIAGSTKPLDAEIRRAIVLHLPASYLTGPGGLLGEISRLLDQGLREEFVRRGPVFRLGGLTFGPFRPRRIRLLGLKPEKDGWLAVEAGIEGVCGDIGGQQGSKRTLCLPVRFRFTFHLVVREGDRVDVRIGPVSTQTLRMLAQQGFNPMLQILLARAPAMVRGVLAAALSVSSKGARRLLRALARAKERLDTRLSEAANLLPTLPRAWGRGGRICLGVTLSRLASLPEREAFELDLDVGIRGWTRGNDCRKPEPFPGGAVRPVDAPGGPDVPNSERPTLLFSTALLNGYLAALTAARLLRRIPLPPGAAAGSGFQVEEVSVPHAPLIRSGSELLVAIPEMGISVEARGEPKRFFRVSIQMGTRLLLEPSGSVSLALMESPLPVVGIRCEGELGGGRCAPQSRRYQTMADLVRRLVAEGRLVLPTVTLTRTLPRWRTEQVELFPTDVDTVPGWLRVQLAVRPLGTR